VPDKEMYGVRLPKDLVSEIEEYRDETGLSKSDAMRSLVRAGLDAEEERREVARVVMKNMAVVSLILAAYSLLFILPESNTLTIQAYTAFFFISGVAFHGILYTQKPERWDEFIYNRLGGYVQNTGESE
jgi:Arc/MetJ-type ribon-helix-helix transcriptional regulator